MIRDFSGKNTDGVHFIGLDGTGYLKQTLSGDSANGQ
jgi:hypothetical protein